MGFWRSIAGMLEVELTSAEPEETLWEAAKQGIRFFGTKTEGELSRHFLILRRDYQQLSAIARKRGENLRILRRHGLYWSGKQLLKRPVLLLGMAFLTAVTLYLPSRILFVRVEGNVDVPTRQILAAAEACGIQPGASRREVRSEKLKNALLSQLPRLQWAGVNTSGCVATISVRERTDLEQKQEDFGISSIVADRDGFILSATVTDGTAMIKEGQSVTKGQVLISGYTDCGICILATRAEGEVIALTSRSSEVAALSESEAIIRKGEAKKKISLLIRKKRINLWKDSGISQDSCGRMYEEYYVTLPGGFQLPIAVCIERFIPYETETVTHPEELIRDAMNAFVKNYLAEQMVAGEILRETTAFTAEDGLYRLHGTFVCREMIGRQRQEQIGDTNGEDS